IRSARDPGVEVEGVEPAAVVAEQAAARVPRRRAVQRRGEAQFPAVEGGARAPGARVEQEARLLAEHVRAVDQEAARGAGAGRAEESDLRQAAVGVELG